MSHTSMYRMKIYLFCLPMKSNIDFNASNAKKVDMIICNMNCCLSIYCMKKTRVFLLSIYSKQLSFSGVERCKTLAATKTEPQFYILKKSAQNDLMTMHESRRSPTSIQLMRTHEARESEQKKTATNKAQQ